MVDAAPLNPRALLFTLYGDYVHPSGEEGVRVNALVRLAGEFGVTGSALRSALSRMTREGWFVTDRDGGRPRYRLSPRGFQLIDEGARRIYSRRGERWDGSWLVVAYSLPERRRGERDRLRDGLSFLGLGSLGNGLFVSPHDLRDEVRRVAERTGALDQVTILWSHLAWPDDPQRMVARAWDLPRVAAGYQRFLHQCQGILADGAVASEAEAFRRRFLLTHAFRASLFGDPDLPTALLPEGWIGAAAFLRFSEQNLRLRPQAERFYRSIALA